MKKNNGLSLILFILIALLFAVCLTGALLIHMKNSGTVAIYHNGALFGRYEINEDQEIDVAGKMTVHIQDGEVFVTDSVCPDHLCEKTSLKYSSVICLPERIEIRKENDTTLYDGISQ